MGKRLLTVVYPRFAEWELVTPLACLPAEVECVYASVGEQRVYGIMGLALDAHLTLRDVNANKFDALLLPGGLESDEKCFPRRLGEDETLLDLLSEFARQDKPVAAVCGAPLVLGAAGLLEGRHFACDVTEDTRGWLDTGCRAEGFLALDGPILTASVRALGPFSMTLAQLLEAQQLLPSGQGAAGNAIRTPSVTAPDSWYGPVTRPR